MRINFIVIHTFSSKKKFEEQTNATEFIRLKNHSRNSNQFIAASNVNMKLVSGLKCNKTLLHLARNK